MRIFKRALLFLAAAPCLAGAQFGGMQPPKADYFPILLLNPSVQHDLGLSPEAAQKEQGLIIQMGMSMLPALQQRASQTPEQRQAFMHKMFKAYEDLENKAVEPLDARQKARLHQLTLQYYGPAALAFPSVSHAVGITPAQQEKLSAILSKSGAGLSKSFSHTNSQNVMSQVGTMRREQNESRAEAERQVNQILTPAQKAKWSALLGRRLPGITDFGGLGGMLGGG